MNDYFGEGILDNEAEPDYCDDFNDENCEPIGCCDECECDLVFRKQAEPQ